MTEGRPPHLGSASFMSLAIARTVAVTLKAGEGRLMVASLSQDTGAYLLTAYFRDLQLQICHRLGL